jgi:hypothetical protein
MKSTDHEKQNPIRGNVSGFANFIFSALITLDAVLIALVIIAIVQYIGG